MSLISFIVQDKAIVLLHLEGRQTICIQSTIELSYKVMGNNVVP
jgi:hypothetical protein